MRFITNILDRLFSKHLLATNTATSGTLMAFGDFIQQRIEIYKNERPYDYRRTRNMFISGLILGPIAHAYYKVIDKRFPARNVRTALIKILIEQTLAAPPFIVIFFMSCGILEGQTIKECYEELKAKFLIMYQIDCLVWPPAQFINFLYINPKYRVFYISNVAMVYDVFLSQVKYNM